MTFTALLRLERGLAESSVEESMSHTMQGLVNALLAGDHKNSLEAAIALHASGIPVEEIVRTGIQPAMEALDNKCTVEQFNLLEIMLTGRAVSMVAEELFPRAGDPPNPKATVVVAALEGDIHDIGKHIVKMVLIGNRYRVVDCGKDVPIEQVVTKVKDEQARALCISGLITSVIPKVRCMKQALADAGLDQVNILAGGAALKQSNAEALQVDYVGETAFDAAAYLEAICGETA
jgi:methanogenic corrinoid protein MtbC1